MNTALPLPLRYYPDPILKVAASEVTEFTPELHKLLDQMMLTMRLANGVGLAAPQIGLSKQIAVIDVSSEGTEPFELINPSIVAREGTVDSEEGCLSIPEFREVIARSEYVKVEGLDRAGNPITIEATGLLSRCLQHEIDHLNGVLFIDHLSALKRELFLKWYKKNGPFPIQE